MSEINNKLKEHQELWDAIFKIQVRLAILEDGGDPQ